MTSAIATRKLTRRFGTLAAADALATAAHMLALSLAFATVALAPC